jgi:hypothetical protein
MAGAIASAVAGAAVCLASFAGSLHAQVVDSTKCDSIVFASRRDSVRTSLYISVKTLDVEVSEELRRHMATAIATVFTAPRPFRISVFAGPAQMRSVRRVSSVDATELRAPTVTGVYRYYSTHGDSVLRPEVIRASLVPGFDSAAFDAIRSAESVQGIFDPPAGVASMLIEVRLSTDSTPNALKFVEATFPRMPVVDAVPNADNPPAKAPIGAQDDSTRRFDVVLSFVVDRAGLPAMETIEVIRAMSGEFLRSALLALPLQRFTPARVNGCAVAQLVSYPFAFVSPERGPPLRH